MAPPLPQGKIKLAEKKNPTGDLSPAVSIQFHRVLQDEIQKRQEADQALRLAEHKYRSIFEHALEGIFQTSANGKYLAANPALIEMYGYDSYAQLARSVSDIATKLYVDPNRRAEFVRQMQERGQVIHFESEILRRDGRRIWISENVRSIYDEQGSFLYYEGTVDNITELREAREKERKILYALEVTQQRLEAELGEAAGYVRSLLPAFLTGKIETDWCYLPSSHLGGDGFGYQPLDPDSLAFYLLDVSGHGVGSALLCISVLNVLRTQSLPATDFHDPSSVLAGLNIAFPMAHHNEKYFTIWYGVLHQPTGILTYASAGHPPAVLVRETAGVRSMLPLQTRGPVIGVVADAKYPAAQATLQAPADLYLFSDGVYEIARPDDSWQSWEELAGYLRSDRPDIASIIQRMREQRGSEFFEDDFSLLKLRLN